MPSIALLSQETIDKIAAGEVIERPSSVVKELVENAIDAGANAVTVEIKDGGTTFIRITDNGCGIEKSQIPLAFLRHSTSKIQSVEDLLTVTSLGFRGEALSSIAAVAQVELITKTPADFTGTRYVIEGSKEVSLEEIGAPEGTTFLVRNLFYNTPVRQKFLKSPQTEGSYIHDLMQRMVLSHPDVSFKFIMNGQVKLQSSGNANIKDIIYHIYGRDITSGLLEVAEKNDLFEVKGLIGKPQISRGNRNYETYFINGRYIKSSLISRAVEEAYKSFLMQHQYPFTVLYLTIDSELLDVNVHPTKMELRFTRQQEIYALLVDIIKNKLTHRELIQQVPVVEEKKKVIPAKIERVAPEPFEKKRLEAVRQAVQKDSPYEAKYETLPKPITPVIVDAKRPISPASIEPLLVGEEISYHVKQNVTSTQEPTVQSQTLAATPAPTYEQESFLNIQAKPNHRIIGQVFKTYWLVEFDEKLYIIDQHAAHEKVLYEQTMAKLKSREHTSQQISPPVVLTLSMSEEDTLRKFRPQFTEIGYQIEHFGGNEYMVSAIPGNLFQIDARDLMLQMLAELSELSGNGAPDLILEKVASMSCKAAVKGNQRLSLAEMEHLIDELLTLENPYNCPHGRPTIISMTKYELEKKFKRIL